MKRSIIAGGLLLLAVGISLAQQNNVSDEGGRVLALEIAWNHALEEKDTKALDMLLANTMVSVDIDGSVSTKSDFLVSIKAADYQPSKGRHGAKHCAGLWECRGGGGDFSDQGNGKREGLCEARAIRGHLGEV
jgi:hypothetical protein